MKNAIASLVGILLVVATGCGGGAEMVQDEDAPLRVEIRGNRIVFNHKIEFEHDSATIREASHPILDEVVRLLGEHEEIYRVQVQGHSSTDGEEQHNLELSTARAASVADYLRSHGVVAEVTSQVSGETYPLCREETDDCHAQNRRVEFFIDSR